MDVASLELCRELYELSGWMGLSYQWTNQIMENNTQEPWIVENLYTNIPPEKSGKYPAYDFGFLIRKLPLKDGTDIAFGLGDDENWSLGFGNIQTYGTTPEDCLAQLAIELIRQEEIKV